MNEESNIAGYTVFYLKQGEPIRTNEGEITQIPVTLEKKIIKPELKESYLQHFGSGKYVPTEVQFTDWLRQAELEVCVSCGLLTNVPKDRHIDERAFYVEGAGQLCESCYNKIYGARMTNP